MGTSLGSAAAFCVALTNPNKPAGTSYLASEVAVGAAGNNGNTTQFWPAACARLIAVGNSDRLDARYTGTPPSNYGAWVSLAAPVEQSVSTSVPGTSCNRFSEDITDYCINGPSAEV